MHQLDLFAPPSTAPPPPALPEGFVYQADFLTAAEERALLEHLAALDYADIRMHGVVARRRAAHFGLDYEYESAAVRAGTPIPSFLLSLREHVATFAGRAAEEFAEVLVTEYPAGAGIGWHRDAPAFEIIVGVSLLGPCVMQFRPYAVEKGQPLGDQPAGKPLSLLLEPRSAYIIRGLSRTAWQHHIPPTKNQRYSITFRTVRQLRAKNSGASDL